eukprot:TRINITY_DN39101_c0_g1_i1.p1 TRINITY_DN39101_c0_g1~~TRINITY_DN39101_c0_g1_i1.p1  ORF type:complete len:452 (+),score=122.35 TRINITY_DN39101_c0_g1_i1:119-1357(+)
MTVAMSSPVLLSSSWGLPAGEGGDSVSAETKRQVGALATALGDEEREMWRQLRRKRDFEDRVAEKRAQLAELRDKRRGISASFAEAAASVDRLTSEVELARRQERELEHDVAVLKESNRILQGAFGTPQAIMEPLNESALSQKPGAEASKNGADVPSAELGHQESGQMLHEQLLHLRGHLERLMAEKQGLQDRQQALFDKQHAAEQDRNRLLSSLQDDRRGINDVRGERIRLWEERCKMEREMAQIVQEAHFGGLDGEGRRPDAPRAVSSTAAVPLTRPVEPPAVPVSGGVRVSVAQDTPICFEPPPARDPARPHSRSRAASPGRLAAGGGGEGPRPHWASFDSSRGATAPFAAAAPSPQHDDGSPPVFGSRGDAGGYGDPGRPPAAGDADGRDGITEWAGRLRRSRSKGAT